MTVIIHYPKVEEDKRELTRRASIVHADTIIQYINKLSCPKEQKQKLYDEIIKAYRDRR